ncbi:transcriptional regulator [Bacillus nakamurai]|uniref:Transcriptional regulator n=1 Tax=Bacillus nakamurai TaxID=1793963 RepID=A0A150F7Q6_9BACI|nr:MerR family transcriptional regulator [Bacillus nakamurai]KXZ17682.1 transcriptional regulator [Bacillus nakamurai]KXZ24126.1 transcriptional regulator [Bacillus nakamurai]MED1227578.1 MerR family transcriptional regulator [Bacillus nakamurai]
MNIKEAARQTGLTKKAIKYYEQEGLITVSKNPDNGYREYSDQDVNTLKMIAALRMLALSVSDIKAFLLEGSSLHDILQQQHQKLSLQIEELEQERKLTEMLMKRVKNTENVDSILHDIGEVKIDEPKYMGFQLKKLFPGEFGEFIATLFEPFFDFAIDTDEKKENWAELIKVLDDMEEVPAAHPMMQLLGQEDPAQLQQYKAQHDQFIELILKKDPATWETHKNILIQLVKRVQTDEEYRESLIKLGESASDLPALKEGSPFSNLLQKLSPKYDTYVQYQLEIKKEADEALGFDSKAYLKQALQLKKR